MTDPRKQSPAEVWRALEKATADAELERIEAMSDDELDAELRAAGIDPAEAAKIGVDVLGPAPASGDGGLASRAPARTGGGVTEVKPVHAEGPPAKGRVYWMAAFAAAAVVIGVLVALPRGGPEVGTGNPETEAALKEAADLRARAFGACDQGYWAACEDALNAARKLESGGRDGAACRGGAAGDRGGRGGRGA